MERFTALIPVRAGSRGIPQKNVLPVAGKPLVQWVVEAAAGCPRIDHVFVATDDPAVRGVIEPLDHARVSVVGRSPGTATDTAPTEAVLLEFLAAHPVENLVLLQATSPLTTSKDISRAIALFEARRADSLVSVCRQRRFLWEEQGDQVAPLNYDPARRPRRQDLDGFLVENGALYIARAGGIRASGSRLHGTIVALEMDPETYVEIDEPADLLLAERLLLARRRDGVAGPHLDALRLVLLDADGVLTDGGMYYGPDGEAMKKFNTRDGMGIARLRAAGIEVGLVTGESSPHVAARAAKLGLREVHLGVADKLARVARILDEHALPWRALAYVGDDVNDLEVLRRAGFAVAVADARPEVKAVAHHVTRARGGEGAVREVADLIVAARSTPPARAPAAPAPGCGPRPGRPEEEEPAPVPAPPAAFRPTR